MPRRRRETGINEPKILVVGGQGVPVHAKDARQSICGEEDRDAVRRELDALDDAQQGLCCGHARQPYDGREAAEVGDSRRMSPS